VTIAFCQIVFNEDLSPTSYGAPQSALSHSRSTKFLSVQHDRLWPMSIFVRRLSCLELTARTFATNHFNRPFYKRSLKTFLFGQISHSAH